MSNERAFETDIDLERGDADDVRGGGIVDASASVSGVGSAEVHDANTSANVLGTSAGTTMKSSSWGAGASGGGQSVKAGGRRPRVRGKRLKRS